MNYRPILLALGILFFTVSISSADLIHHYKFDSDASDSAGTANGSLLNGASVGGGTLNLDGQNDYVQFGSYLVPGSGSYSVALFAKWAGGDMKLSEMISQGRSTGPGFYIGLKDATGEIRASDTWQSTGVFMPNDGQFHHLALTVDSTAGKSFFYLNGSLAATLNQAITTELSTMTTRFGQQFTSSEYFRGSLDDVRVYNNTLSASDVANLAGVPEPGAVWLCSLFGVTLLTRRRRNS